METSLIIIIGVFVIILIIIVILAIRFCVYDSRSVDPLSGDIKLYKSSNLSIFIYTGIYFPENITVYKPKFRQATERVSVDGIKEYLGVLNIKETLYISRGTPIDSGEYFEFVVYSYPTMNIVATYPMQKSKEIKLEPGDYVIVMLTNSQKDMDAKISKKVVKDELEEIKTPLNSEKIVLEVIDKMESLDYTLEEHLTDQNSTSLCLSLVPNNKIRLFNISVKEGDYISLIVQPTGYKTTYDIISEKSTIKTESDGTEIYINTYEMTEDTDIIVKISSYCPKIKHNSVDLLIFS